MARYNERTGWRGGRGQGLGSARGEVREGWQGIVNARGGGEVGGKVFRESGENSEVAVSV